MAKKTDRMTCTYTADAVVYNAERANGDKWEVYDSRTFKLGGLLNNAVYDGPNDTKVTLAAYGLRALLADRTSQLRELGPKAVLEGMDSLFAVLTDPVNPQWNVARKAGGAKRVDMVLVELIMELKECSMAAAEELVRKTPPETLTAIIAKYADKYAELKAKAAKAAGEVDLGDLLDL